MSDSRFNNDFTDKYTSSYSPFRYFEDSKQQKDLEKHSALDIFDDASKGQYKTSNAQPGQTTTSSIYRSAGSADPSVSMNSSSSTSRYDYQNEKSRKMVDETASYDRKRRNEDQRY